MITQPATAIALYDEGDTPWIAQIVDQVLAVRGQPWRVLREHLEASDLPAVRVTAIVAAMRRVLGGRVQRTRVARKLRSIVLGHPALDAAARTERLVAAEAQLGIPADELETLLWIDLADERPVDLPHGRPDELGLAALANLDRIARIVRRARRVRIHVRGDATELVRAAARFGLMVTIGGNATPALEEGPRAALLAPVATIDSAALAPVTTLDIAGPLTLFHATAIYGSALAALVPYLRAYAKFLVEIDADFGFGPAAFRLSSPALLPPPVPPKSVALRDRIQRALARAAPRARIACEPPPIQRGGQRLFPSFAVEHPIRGGTARTRWWIELVGFATREYLQRKLAAYEAAGIRQVVLLVLNDAASDADPPFDFDPRVLRYRARTVGADLLAAMGLP